VTEVQTGRTLVACLGNIFLSDDGFGVEVARRLARYELPDGVRVTDYGIRGMHLAYDLAEGFDRTILVDATQRGGEPGTVYLIEPAPAPAPDAIPAGLSLLNAHGMQPDLVLSLAGTLGADAGQVLVVGCEPATLDEGIGLSAPVAAAVDDAVRMVTVLVRGDGPAEPPAPDRRSAPSGGTPPRQDHDLDSDPKATEG
jgi:hydrogenase maturation protease